MLCILYLSQAFGANKCTHQYLTYLQRCVSDLSSTVAYTAESGGKSLEWFKKIFSSVRLCSQYLELIPDWKWDICWEETGNITVQLPFYSPTDGTKQEGRWRGVWNSLKYFSMLKTPLLFQKTSAPTGPWASVVWSEGQGVARDFFVVVVSNNGINSHMLQQVVKICLASSWRADWRRFQIFFGICWLFGQANSSSP